MNKFEKIFVLLTLTSVFYLPTFAQKKTVKKSTPKPPVSKKVSTIPNNGLDNETTTKFSMTIGNGNQKKEISNTFFEESENNTIAAGDNKLLLFSAGSNKTDNDRYSFNAAIPKFAKGIYTIKDIDQNPFFSITSSDFPKVGALKAKSGTIEITAYPSGAGFVEGKFSGVCVSTNDDGTFGNFKISGSFRLRKRLE